MNKVFNNNQEQIQKFYMTNSYPVAAALMMNGHEPAYVTKDIDGEVYFSFEDNPKLRQLVGLIRRNKLKVSMDFYDWVRSLEHEPFSA